jgi:hypothetical protein
MEPRPGWSSRISHGPAASDLNSLLRKHLGEAQAFYLADGRTHVPTGGHRARRPGPTIRPRHRPHALDGAPRASGPAAIPLQREREDVLVEAAVARVVEYLLDAGAGLHRGHLQAERASLEDRVEAALDGAHREAQQGDR